MTQAEFLEAFQNILQCESAVTSDSLLKEMEEWDSLAYMATIAFFDLHFSKRLTFENLIPCQTVADIMKLSAGNIA